MSRCFALTGVLFGLAAASLSAQWLTEFHQLKAGWNAIYPFVDAGDVTLTELTDNRIVEVWRWNPGALDALALGTPSAPVLGDEWARWRRGFPIDSTFDRLEPNFGYLVNVAAGTAAYTLNIKGRAAMPRVQWRNDGLNLVGFPAVPPPAAPTIGAYLSPAGLLSGQTEIFRYVGGALSNNPVELLNPVQQSLPRGEAFWIDTGRFSDYYGPIKVEVSLSPEGLHYGTAGTTQQLVVRNRTARAQTVTLTPVASETDRSGSPVNPVPLRERVFDPNTQNFTYPPIGGPVQLQLEPGQTVSKLLVADRAGLTGPAGSVNASLLRVTDGEGLSRIDIPVSATVSDLSGLWVGEAAINAVQNQLQQFEREEDGTYRYDANGERIPLDGTGDNTLHQTAQTYPIRLVVHVDGAGQARLLSKVFAGPIATQVQGEDPEFGLATDQSLLDSNELAGAVRITAVHFPLDLNQALTGGLGPGGSLAGTVTLAHDDKVNPFVHTYHPDHDNLDARFENALPAGAESHAISRALQLAFDTNGSTSGNPAWGATFLTGTYRETISGLHKNTLDVEGPFFLRRLTEANTLHTP